MACCVAANDEFWRAGEHIQEDIPNKKKVALGILVKLRADGMSSDECQGTAGVLMYAQKTHKWRSAVLQALLNDIRLWLKKNQHITLLYSESEVPSSHPAPTGLPESCYHDQWLKDLTPQQRKDLQMTR